MSAGDIAGIIMASGVSSILLAFGVVIVVMVIKE